MSEDTTKQKDLLSDQQTEQELEPQGIKCPKCKCQHWRIVNTAPIAFGVRRYRRCRHCGYTMSTRERPENQKKPEKTRTKK